MAPETGLRHLHALGGGPASMRPGHDGPGNIARRLDALRGADGFNEAGARWPRKHGSSGGGSGRRARFNEAGARWPRKRCGSRRPCSCSTRFNEAGARWPRKRVPDRDLEDGAVGASMRPGHDGPGNENRLVLGVYALVASMRPGHDGPGNGAWAWKLLCEEMASMRPGHDGPGNAVSTVAAE